MVKNQLIGHFAVNICHISSQNVYISATKVGGGLKIGSEYQKCILVSCAQLISDCNTVEHGQNQLIGHFAVNICHISSQNGYISATKLAGGLKIGQNIRNVFQFLGLN